LIGITGAEGFIGSHLVEKLIDDGHRVRAMVQYNSNSEIGWIRESRVFGNERLEIFFGDVRDPSSTDNFLVGIDRVAHLAALIAIPYSYQAPQSYVETNVIGTLNLLQSARRNNVERVVVTSTSEVYGSAQYVPMDEGHPLVAQSPYAASKTGADQLALSFASSFDLNVAVLRPFNTFGPRQSLRAVIPTVISQVISGGASISLGRVDTTRDYTYVEDTAKAFESILMSDHGSGEVFNFGSGFELSIGEIVSIVQELAGTSLPLIAAQERIRPDSSEVTRLYSDPAKFFSRFEFGSERPNLQTFRGHLEKTIEWFQSEYHRGRAFNSGYVK
jgi:dTDP-glucose 4,6-dehydratase